MDPLSIAGTVLAIGQCIGPIVNGIRALRKFKEIEDSVLAALEESENHGMKLQMWLEAIGDIDEKTVSLSHMAYLQRTLSGLQVAAASHEAEVRSWLRALGLPDKLQENSTPDRASDSETTLVEGDKSESSDTSTTFTKHSRRRRVFSRLSKLVHIGNCSSRRGHELEQLETTKTIKNQAEKSSNSSKAVLSFSKKVHYIVLGEHSVKSLASKLVYWDYQLFTGYMTVATMSNLSQSILAKKDLHPTARFVVEARERVAQGGDVTVIEPEVWKRYYDDNMKLRVAYVDKNASESMKQCQVLFGHFEPKCDDPNDEVGRKLESYRSCVYIDRGLMEGEQRAASLALATLFSGSQNTVEVSDKQREDGDMLRCAAMANVSGNCVLLFKLPPGSSPNPISLRSALLDPRATSGGYALHPISDRVKLATRLTTALFVIHSLGYVHKRINPEKILLVESASGGSSQSFPKRLGYPYLVAFHLSRGHSASTSLVSHFTESQRRGIYFHFRDQDVKRDHRYNMKDDIYALGVCLFEIALWRSLFVWDEDMRDYVYDDSFVALSDEVEKLKGMGVHEKARTRTEELIRVAEERIPGVLGHAFTKAVIACLKAHSDDNPFANHPRLKNIRKAPVSKDACSDEEAKDSEQKIQTMECLAYLELVLHQLHAVHRGLLDTAV